MERRSLRPAPRTSAHLRRASRAPVGALLTALLLAGPATPYGYSRADDPLLHAFDAAVRAARRRDLAQARARLAEVRWQIDELKQDLRVDLDPALARAHADGASPDAAVEAWANLVYLALLQKFHWNLAERLADYGRGRARLESAVAYYELALAGNVRRQDAARREADPRAPSRHEDIVRRFEVARSALGSPGLFGTGARPPDVERFREAVVAIAGHLRAAFPGFVHPGPASPGGR